MRYGPIEVEIREDGMLVTATLLSASVPEVVVAALEQVGVVAGVDLAAVRHLCTVGHGSEVVARGKPAVDGQDTTVEYSVVELAAHGGFTGVEDEHGTVDLRGGHVTVRVSPGQWLARRVPATPGTDGFTVRGEPLPAKPGGGEVKLLVGEGAQIVEGQAVARIAGVPGFKDGAIVVRPVLTVKNVDYHAGDVHFVGAVVVEGDVLPGFTVQATGDITIKGQVEGGKIESGGNVFVGGAVRRQAEIVSHADLTVRFVDPQCVLRAHGRLVVKESAVQSTLSGHRVTVGKQIVACKVTAVERIEAEQVGNTAEAPTWVTVQAAGAPLSAAGHEGVSKQLAAAELELERVRKEERAGVKDPKAAKALAEREISLEFKVLRFRRQLAEADAPAADPEAGEIVVHGEVHRGAVVTLHGHELKPKATEANRRYHLENGGVVG